MASLIPFRALRPRPDVAQAVAAPPYDVVSREEAAGLAAGNPLSFLRVSRAELELPVDVDQYADIVYEHARANYRTLTSSQFELEQTPSLYLYRLRTGDHEQTGIAACFALDDYDRDIIKKHERTRRDKEDDRTRHMVTLGAQTGPVFLTYHASADVNDIVREAVLAPSLIDFTAADGVTHTIWRLTGPACERLTAAFSRVPALYIADGHHRAASAARARTQFLEAGSTRPTHGDGADFRTMLAVAFPHDQVHILPYNRVVKDLAGHSVESFLAAVDARFHREPGGAAPAATGAVSMYVAGQWHTLRPKQAPAPDDVIAALDVSVLQDQLLAPVLGIHDVRTDKRIDFVGGGRGTAELERLVESGRFAVAFSMYPVSVTELMEVSDANAIMPPKSTWFEPKLRDGLLIHEI
jgi:uncharacterized protein (DUF1015 family)